MAPWLAQPVVPGWVGGWDRGKRLAHLKKGSWKLVPEISYVLLGILTFVLL